MTYHQLDRVAPDFSTRSLSTADASIKSGKEMATLLQDAREFSLAVMTDEAKADSLKQTILDIKRTAESMKM